MASLRHILFLGLVVLLVLGVNGTPEAEKEKEIIHKKHHRQHHHHHESSHKEKTKIHKGSPHDPKGVVAEVITDVAEAAPAVIEEGAKIIEMLTTDLNQLKSVVRALGNIIQKEKTGLVYRMYQKKLEPKEVDEIIMSALKGIVNIASQTASGVIKKATESTTDKLDLANFQSVASSAVGDILGVGGNVLDQQEKLDELLNPLKNALTSLEIPELTGLPKLPGVPALPDIPILGR